MMLYVFFRWLVDTMQYCDRLNSNLYDMPNKLQPSLKILGTYLMAWVACS